MLAWFQFNEVSPSAPGTVASSQTVMSAGSFLPIGIAGPLDDGEAVDIVAQLVGASGGSLSVFLQTSIDELNWFDSIAFPSLTSGASAIIYRTSITHLSQPSSAAPVVVGMNLSPALAAGNVVQGGWGTRMRIVMVAGSGTTAGAAVKVTVGVQRPRLEIL